MTDLNPDGIANLLQELSENELDNGELCVCVCVSCSTLDSDEGIRLNESDCEESEESADVFNNIPVNPDIYVSKRWHRVDTA
ncbi:hypothetical protein TNCV_264831 [Trichonephila clavipes]|nr:hypothetical protein TNCV_264831 [Trichonephila clavipes]